jgi:hypothetical protein
LFFFAALPWVFSNKWLKLAGISVLALLVGFFVITWVQPHYSAPITGVIFLIVVHAIRRLRLWRPRHSYSGRRLVSLMIAVYFVSYAFAFLLFAFNKQIWPDASWGFKRAGILAHLEQTEGLHLVIVRYGRAHNTVEEWVYNRANIDREKIVWAREMDPASNLKLLTYFCHRRVWLLRPDGAAPILEPYSWDNNTKVRH